MRSTLFYLVAFATTCSFVTAGELDLPPSPLTAESARMNAELAPIGKDYSISIKDRGEIIRRIHVREGHLPDDKKHGQLVVFTPLCPIALKSTRPMKELPEIVWDVEGPDETGKSGLKLKLHHTSQTLQDGVAAFVRTAHRARNVAKSVEPQAAKSDQLTANKPSSSSVGELSVRVQPDSALKLFFAVLDATNNVMLGFGENDIQSEGDAIEMWVSMDAASLHRFLELYPQGGKLKYAFAVLRYGTRMDVAYQSTNIDIDLGKIAESVLTSEQKQKQIPILQSDEIKLKQQLSIRVRRDMSVKGSPEVLSLVGQDAALLGGLISRHEDLSFNDFHQTFPRYTDAVLADYLASSLKTVLNSSGKHEDTSQKSVVESVSLDGKGMGFHIPYLGGQLTSDEHDRTLKMLETVSGVTLNRVTKSTFSPHRIRVHHLADGWQTARVSSAGYYALGKGDVAAYVSDTPLPQSLTIETLNAVMNELIAAEERHFSSLEMKRRTLVVNRDDLRSQANQRYATQRTGLSEQLQQAWNDVGKQGDLFAAAASEYDKFLGAVIWLNGAVQNGHQVQIHQPGAKSREDAAKPARDAAEKKLRESKDAVQKAIDDVAQEDSKLKSLLSKIQELDREITEIERAMFTLSK